MTQFIQKLFISYLFFVLSIKSNQICQQYNPNEQGYIQLAFQAATTLEKYENDLQSSVAQIFNLNVQDQFDQSGEPLSSTKYSFNVYQFPHDNIVKQEKKNQMEIHLRYMLFFRKSFEFKHLSDFGCYIHDDGNNFYLILKFPGERVEINNWFNTFNHLGQQKNLLQIPQEEIDYFVQQKNQDYIRKAVGLNPFFAMDISLQFLIAVAKMHKKKLIHLNLKPYNLKLLNRYCLALDNFENTFLKLDDEQEFHQKFSAENPYNGFNLVQQNSSNVDFTDDLHSAGLVIYQLCVNQTYENKDLLNEIKSNFANVQKSSLNQNLFKKTQNWCSQIVHRLLFSNGRIQPSDIKELQSEDFTPLNDGTEAVKFLLKTMISMKKKYQEDFKQYYQKKNEYLGDQTQLSASTKDFLQDLWNQTNLIQHIISKEDIEGNIEALLQDTSTENKSIQNLFQILPQDKKILDINQQFELPELDQVPEQCLNQDADISVGCLDVLLQTQLKQQQTIEEIRNNVAFDIHEPNYKNQGVFEIMDQKQEAYGYDLQFNFTPPQNTVQNNSLFQDELYLLI